MMGFTFKGASFLAVCVFMLLPLSHLHAAEPFQLTSPDISPGKYIPAKFSCQRQNVSPRLEFINVPDKAKSLALIVHDPDAPSGDWVHWVVFNIRPDEFEVAEGFAPGIEGRNSSGENRWEGPCPPSGTHHYVFEAYALDIELGLKEGASREDAVSAMQGHILAKAELVGLYEKF